MIFGKFYFTQADADWTHSHGWDDYDCGAKLLLRLDCIGLYEFNMVQWLLSMAHYTITIKIYIYFNFLLFPHFYSPQKGLYSSLPFCHHICLCFVFLIYYFVLLLFLDSTDSLPKIVAASMNIVEKCYSKSQIDKQSHLNQYACGSNYCSDY